jgi:cyclophilin family peptidyl-prolyl cis-trans isomerase
VRITSHFFTRLLLRRTGDRYAFTQLLTPIDWPTNLKVSAILATLKFGAGSGMRAKSGIVLLICLSTTPFVSAQSVVRFETSVGEFDMVLNPTNNPLLEAQADNMLRYVEDNRYSGSWINRADENFVLQMGGFYSHTKRPPPTIASTRPVATFAPVAGEPAIPGLSNTVGTVALALPSDANGPLQDAGTSSFFVNLISNTSLDEDFTVFAAIPDMTVINRIMSLMQVDRTTDPAFGAGPNNLAFTDVPLQENGFQVFINRAFVLSDAMAIARARSGVTSTIAASAQAASGESSALSLAAAAVPEPTTMTMLFVGLHVVVSLMWRSASPRD